MPYKRTSIESSGGAEVWVSHFALEHAKRGHHIDLYASKGSLSTSNITLLPFIEQPLSEYYGNPHFADDPLTLGRKVNELACTTYMRALESIRKRAAEYDIVIDSTASAIFPFSSYHLGKPVISIGHDPPDFYFEFYCHLFSWPEHVTVVFPSKYQYELASSIPSSKRAIIPHGIDLTLFQFNESCDEHMVWLSRIDVPRQDKGAHDAMVVASRLRCKLKVIGLVEPASRTYVERALKPLTSQIVTFEEEDGNRPTDKNAIFGPAKAFLFPTKWEESFGLVMAEAMACGTPVVAYARGAVPEVVADGETGFVVNPSDDDIRGDFLVKKTGIDGLCEAVERIYAMSSEDYSCMRKNCRARVEQHFTVERMVDQYEQLYEKLLT